MVEPSHLAVIGRYLLRPEIFEVLPNTTPGRGNEIQLTAALQVMAANPQFTDGVYGVIFRGRGYGTGDGLDIIKAIVQLATGRPDLGPDLPVWLQEFPANRTTYTTRTT